MRLRKNKTVIKNIKQISQYFSLKYKISQKISEFFKTVVSPQ